MRFGEMVGLASNLSGSGSGAGGESKGAGGCGFLGGLPRFLFTGTTTEFSLGSVPDVDVGSLPGGVSVFLG